MAEIVAQPAKYSGQRVAVFIEARVTAPTAEGFILTQRGTSLQVHAPNPNVPINEFVAVAGTFQPPNLLYADTVHWARGRRWKMAVSALPVLALIFLLPMALYFDRQTRTFRLRSSASP